MRSEMLGIMALLVAVGAGAAPGCSPKRPGGGTCVNSGCDPGFVCNEETGECEPVDAAVDDSGVKDDGSLDDGGPGPDAAPPTPGFAHQTTTGGKVMTGGSYQLKSQCGHMWGPVRLTGGTYELKSNLATVRQ